MPLGQAIVEEGTASSSSLEEEIDRFQFEEEAIVISEAEEEADEYSCDQTLAQFKGTYERQKQDTFSPRQKQVQTSCKSSSSSSSSASY